MSQSIEERWDEGKKSTQTILIDYENNHDHHHNHTAEVNYHDHGHGHDLRVAEREALRRAVMTGGDDDCCSSGSCSSSGNHTTQEIKADQDHDHNHGHMYSQSYDHGHDHTHSTAAAEREALRKAVMTGGDDDCCSSGSCSTSGNHTVQAFTIDHDHGHGHGHNAVQNGTLSCSHVSTSSEVPFFGHDHHYNLPRVAPSQSKIKVSSFTSDIQMTIASSADNSIIEVTAQTCSQCDAKSDIPHAIRVTRFRIANLCCAGEERIIRTSLEGVIGIEHIDVNIIGRYAVVKHCPVACCAPSDRIVEILNGQRLGASVAEAAGEDEEEEFFSFFDVVKLIHVAVVGLLFIAGTITQKASKSELPWIVVYLMSTGLGLVPVLQEAYLAIIRCSLDIHILIVVATAGAIALEDYMDASLLIALFIAAESVEDVVMRWVRKSIKVSTGKVPKKATLASGKSVDVESIKIGDIISVRAGEMVQLDGVVVKGEGVVDESALTGEATPLSKKKGDKVCSGAMTQDGYLEIEVEAVAADSTIRKLNQAVLDVQADKGSFGRIVDSFAKYWTPLSLGLALLTLVIGGAVSDDWSLYGMKALVVLVLACPCSLVLAAPIPGVCAIATAARHRVLVRGSSVIESAGVVTAVALDKTGTLTKGFFRVCDRLLIGEASQSGAVDALEMAASLEQKSAHPLASAIVSAHCGCIAEMEGDLLSVRKLKTVEGVGIEGWVQVAGTWKLVAVGNEKLLSTNGGKVQLGTREKAMVANFSRRNGGAVLVYICVEDELEMMLALADELRGEAAATVGLFQRMGLSVNMLTGDHIVVAAEVCRQVGIPDEACRARLLPQEKLDWIKQSERAGRRVLMVGDGINDAAALAGASVGVAMGAGGTAMAAAAADIVMMSDNLLRLPATLELCRQARKIILQNCAFSVSIKIMAVVLAFFGKLKLWQAVLIDIGSLLVVIANGTRPLAAQCYVEAEAGFLGPGWAAVAGAALPADSLGSSSVGGSEMDDGASGIFSKPAVQNPLGKVGFVDALLSDKHDGSDDGLMV